MPYLNDPRWKELNDRFFLLTGRVRRAANRQQRRMALQAFLSEAERALMTHSPCDEMQVFQEVSCLLGERLCDRELWDWITKISASANSSRRRMLKEGLLELVPEPPVNHGDLENLWRMWRDPRTRWAVLCAYEEQPNQLLADSRTVAKVLGGELYREANLQIKKLKPRERS